MGTLDPEGCRRRREQARIAREELALVLSEGRSERLTEATIRRLETGIKTDPPKGYESLDAFWASHDEAVRVINARRLSTYPGA